MTEEEARERQRQRARKHYEKHREAILERERQQRRDPVAGPEKRRRERERVAALPEEERERQRERTRDWYRRNPRSREEHGRLHLLVRYRLTPAGKQQLLDDQGGRCYLCGDVLDLAKPRTIHVDHDHVCCPGGTSCGKCIRGIACDPCNRGIGYFRDDPERMRRVAGNLEAANRRLRE